MEATKRQSYWWWFDSHNSPRRSQWLQSTITELDQKTKAMLRLIEQDADSFAQRAEMYYKKRPDLISMVEDFYRAHRSLAERFDQLRNDPVNRITSPLAHSLSFPKGQLREVASNLYNSFDSYSNKGYDSEDSAELSEVDDPVQEDSNLIGKGMEEEEVSSPHAVVYEDVTKLKKEINGLKEENKIQIEIIHREEKAKQELKVQLSGISNELQTLREEIERLRKERTLIMMQQNDEKCDEITKLREDNKIQKQLVKREEKAKEELKMQLSETNNELQKLREQIEELRKEKTVMMMQRDEKCDEMTNKREEMGRLEVENRVQKEQLMQKDEEKREVIRQLSLAMEMIREENLLLKKSIVKGTPKKRSNPLEFYGFKSLGKLFHSSSTMPQSRSSVVVPL